MTLQSRLLGVFAQYPDPRVGILTTEVVVPIYPRTTSPYLSAGKYPYHYPYHHRDRYSTFTGLVQARLDLAILQGTELTDEDMAVARNMNPLLDDEDARVVGMYWIDMLRSGKYYGATDERIMATCHDITEATKYDALVPWLARLVAVELKLVRKGKQDARALYLTLKRWPRDLSDIADWAHATRPDLMRLTWNQAIYRSRRWHAALQRQEEAAAAIPGKVVYTFADGWTVQELSTAAQLKDESRMMRHCVGASPVYLEAIQQGKGRIYSIRDTTGHSVVTLELTPPRPSLYLGRKPRFFVQQAKLRANMLPHSEAICDKIVEAASYLHWGFHLMSEGAHDLRACFDFYYRKCLRRDPDLPDYMKKLCDNWRAIDPGAFRQRGAP